MHDNRILQSRPGRWKKAYLLLFALGLCCVGNAVETVSAQQPTSPVLVGAGDIAGCSWDTDVHTAVLLDNIVAQFPSATVFTAGDNAYPNGTTADFDCYQQSWGRHKARTRPSPGNHDYNSSGATPYYTYFGANAGPAGRGYYSYDLGDWHIISLNSNVPAGAGSAQEQWLRDDLRTNPASCTLAYWHHPLFSSGNVHGNNPHMQALFQALYEFGADVVITGHEHIYERFAPQRLDAQGNAQADTTGIRAFVVGTGGTGLYGIGTIRANSQVRSATHGVLKLTLNSTSYDWEFIPIAGQTFRDSGTALCFSRPQVTITATDATATEANSNTGTFTVTRTGPTTSALTVLYSLSGTATAVSDYGTLSGSVIIPSGATSATITVTPVNDPQMENNETVTVMLTANAAYAVGAPNSATVTIISDEVLLPTVSVAATDATATEAGLTTGTFTVTRTGPTTSALTVLYSANGTATAGSDYTALSGRLTIPSGAISASITVTPLDDLTVEGNETVIVTVTANAAYTVGAPGSATVTIVSNDGANLPVVTITAPDGTATEAGPTTGAVQVARSGGNTAAPLTVRYTVNGTATAGSDYTALSGSREILANSLSRGINIIPINDALVEDNETVIVSLVPDSAYTIGSSSSATVTITSDDVAPLPTVTIAAPDATATEADLTTGTLTVSRTGATTAALTVTYSVGGAAAAGSDYMPLAGSVTIPVGATNANITVRPLEDLLVENNETVTVTLTANAAYIVGALSSATVTITSNDGAPPPTNVSLKVNSVYDNKTGKTYRTGGPDGSDPLNDLNTLAEEYKFEIEAGPTYWWEATYTDPVSGSAAPSEALVSVQYRSETDWTGTLTVAYYHGTTRLASTPLPVNSRNDPAAGKGQKHTFVWQLPSVATTAQALRDARVRLINESTNGKKVWVTYSVTEATQGAAP